VKRQRGYYDMDFTGFFVLLIGGGAIFGASMAYFVPWLWSVAKPYIHAITG
jgi:hypothetical protein